MGGAPDMDFNMRSSSGCIDSSVMQVTSVDRRVVWSVCMRVGSMLARKAVE